MWLRCNEHLRGAGESYFQHLRFAASVGLVLVAAGLACIIHALVPALCEKTASRTVHHLTTMFGQRDLMPAIVEEASGALTLVGLIIVAAPAWALLLLAPDKPLALGGAVMAAAIPLTYLWTNPQLEPVD